MSWREQFWPAVCEHFGVEPTGEESRYCSHDFIFLLSDHFFKMLLNFNMGEEAGLPECPG